MIICSFNGLRRGLKLAIRLDEEQPFINPYHEGCETGIEDIVTERGANSVYNVNLLRLTGFPVSFTHHQMGCDVAIITDTRVLVR